MDVGDDVQPGIVLVELHLGQGRADVPAAGVIGRRDDVADPIQDRPAAVRELPAERPDEDARGGDDVLVERAGPEVHDPKGAFDLPVDTRHAVLLPSSTHQHRHRGTRA